MRNFLISRFISFNIIYQSFLDEKRFVSFTDENNKAKETFNISMRALGKAFLNLVVSSETAFIVFFVSIWKFIKYVTLPFRKATYEYTAAALIGCLFVTIFYPNWKWTDYSWLVFFFVLMGTILIITLQDQKHEK